MAKQNEQAHAIRLGTAEVERRTNLEKSYIYRLYMRGRFPAPHYIGNRRMWWLEEIEAWEREEMARPRNPSKNLRHAGGHDE